MEVPARIEVSDEGRLLRITWEDGAATEVAAARLREACPCASCGEVQGRSRIVQLLQDPASVRISGADLVGDYAITFMFAPDGHSMGIYPFSTLRDL